MKRILLLLTTSLLSASLFSQITIGSAMNPNKGSLLDLKENDQLNANSIRGLALPRVQLTTISTLDDIATGLDKDEHIGLTIYVPEEFENSCPGVYVWKGSEWQGINTDALRSPEFTTATDIDGNTYTAKIFNKKGCTGGVYWFTSNLRTTQKNDGTAFHKPLYFSGAKAVNVENPFNENSIVNFHQVKSKSDISTSTDPDKMITFYLNNQKTQMTQDAFVTKFGLHYTYYMAMPRDGQAEEDVKICPVGWKVPILADWVKLLEEVTGISGNSATSKAGYLFASNDIYEPDGREAFDGVGEYLSVEGWLVTPPKNMVGFPAGTSTNPGLNIYPAGQMRVKENGSMALDANFGSVAFLLEKGNGAISLYTSKLELKGSSLAEYKKEIESGNVRCIKVVE